MPTEKLAAPVFGTARSKRSASNAFCRCSQPPAWVVKRAADAGCKVLRPLEDMFWGDRFGALTDPFGNQWSMATHKEDVPPKEMARRAQAAMAAKPGAAS